MFIFISESFSSVRNDAHDKKVHFMGFQKLEVNDTILSINDPDVFNKVDSNLINIFDSIQRDFGQPIKVKWGYRDQRTNRQVGGARNSAHIYGKALDLCLDSPSRESIKKLITISSKYNILGIGVYSDAQVLHIDIDTTKGRRVWGSSYHSSSVPRWASIEVKQHLSKNSTLCDSIKVIKIKPVIVEDTKIVKLEEPKKVIRSEEKTKSKIQYYTVKKGDTLYSLAKNNGTTVDSLCRINNIENFNIKIGQKIKIN
jgi:LysM repeat protein